MCADVTKTLEGEEPHGADLKAADVGKRKIGAGLVGGIHGGGSCGIDEKGGDNGAEGDQQGGFESMMFLLKSLGSATRVRHQNCSTRMTWWYGRWACYDSVTARDMSYIPVGAFVLKLWI